jgi:hypothetical protein
MGVSYVSEPLQTLFPIQPKKRFRTFFRRTQESLSNLLTGIYVANIIKTLWKKKM